MSNGTLWAELLAYGSGIALSPLHIGLLLLLLLGPNPLRRGGLLVLGWMLTTCNGRTVIPRGTPPTNARGLRLFSRFLFKSSGKESKTFFFESFRVQKIIFLEI